MRSGQALVIILLILAVVLTVGLAVISRSITEVSISTAQEESTRALAAAESGIEAALAAVVASGETRTVGEAGATYTVSALPYGGGGEISLSDPLVAGEVATVFLSGHDEAGKLVVGLNRYTADVVSVCWGQNVSRSDAAAPALEVTLYYQTAAGQAAVGRQAFDPVSSRRNRNNFATIDSGSGNCPADRSWAFSKNVSLRGGGGLGMPSDGIPIFLRLRLIYNADTGHYVGVKAMGGAVLPVQGVNVTSTGQAGSTVRRVQVFQRYPDLSSLFDSALFSGAGLTK